MTEERRKTISARLPLLLFSVMLLALALAACGTTETPTPPPTAVPDQTAYHDDLALGHLEPVYDIGVGPNTFCTRCHSPFNWDPDARPYHGYQKEVDPPVDNCMTCKMAPMDKEIRIAPEEYQKLVTEDAWVGITCEVCHEVNASGIASSEVVYWNNLTKAYDPIRAPNELCEKCHGYSTGYSDDGGQDKRIFTSSAHTTWAGLQHTTDVPNDCIECHDAHSLEPKECLDCHSFDDATAMAPRYGWSPYGPVYGLHKDKVECIACHYDSEDPAGLKPGLDEDSGMWTLLGTSGTPTHSHAIQWAVSCESCHTEDNAYGMPWLTAEGEPAASICVAGRFGVTTTTVAKENIDKGYLGVAGEDFELGACPPSTGGPPAGGKP